VPARLYTPSEAAGLPLVVYFHGGGFVTGDLDTHDSIVRQLAVACDTIILSVDYRLAPENPFPAGVEDAESALKFAISNASTFNANPDAVFASGDSAGGALAIAAAPVAPNLAGLLLFYPVTDLTRIGKSESYRQFGDGSAGLSESDMHWLADHYTPDGRLRQEWRCSPLLAGEDTRFPPVFIATAQFDVLRSEGEAFARLMASRGVATEHYAVSGVNHGFLGAGTAVPQVIATYAAAAAWMASITAALK
jgi:acetyl esterase